MTDETDRPDDTEGEGTPPEVDFNAEMESLVEGAAGMFESLRDIFLKSKQEVVRGAKLGKIRIDVFQLRKDREHFLQRLGEEAYELLLASEIAHGDLEKPLAKLKALDEKIAEYETEMAKIAEEVAEQAEEARAEVEAELEREAEPEAEVPEETAQEASDPTDPSDKPKKPKAKKASKKGAAKNSGKGAKKGAKKDL